MWGGKSIEGRRELAVDPRMGDSLLANNCLKREEPPPPVFEALLAGITSSVPPVQASHN